MARQRRLFFRSLQSLLKFLVALFNLAHLRRRTSLSLWIFAFGLLFLGFALPVWLSGAVSPVAAQVATTTAPCPSKGTLSISQLVQCARELYDQGNFKQSVDVWQQAADSYERSSKNRGGINEDAIEALINKAKALQALGLNLQALDILEPISRNLQTQPDSHLKLVAMRNFGDALRLVGTASSKDPKEVLQNSLKIAQKLHLPQDIADIELSLGNIARMQRQPEEAFKHYQTAAKDSAPATKIQAQLSLLHLLLDDKDVTDARACLESNNSQSELKNCTKQIEQALKALGPAQELWPNILTEINSFDQAHLNWIGVYNRINLAQSLMQLSQSLTQLGIPRPQAFVLNPESIRDLLVIAVEQAKTLGDQRTLAYALGNLGELYTKTGQTDIAQPLIEQALSLAQANNAFDVAYRWQWQLGQILKGKGDPQSREIAIAYYGQAVENLKALRGDLVATNRDVQFSFKESVEPVYREFVDLLLQTDKANKADKKDSQPSQENLRKARDTIESLQVAELDNFFREACLEPKQDIDKVVDKEDPTTAVIYPIILADRLEVILRLPKQGNQQEELRRYPTFIPQEKVEQILGELRDQVIQAADPDDTAAIKATKSLSSKVYEWLIPKPDLLAQNGIKNLVFVLDGSLRTIPMAVLYDHNREHYLIEQYSIALAPSLSLVDPKRLKRQELKVLAAGISEARPQLDYNDGLPNVKIELEELQKLKVPIQIFLNQQFTGKILEDQIQLLPYPVVHLATHGEFGSTAEYTYILAWDKKINANELSKSLQIRNQRQARAVELLVLSACQTAAGDSRAALGLAGIAMRAGARSTLASLWNLNDQSTAVVMERFYRELGNIALTKAQALQNAQVALLKEHKYSSPAVWAPYVLVGNWL